MARTIVHFTRLGAGTGIDWVDLRLHLIVDARFSDLSCLIGGVGEVPGAISLGCLLAWT